MQRILSGFLLILSAAFVWMSNPPQAFDSVLVVLGIDPESPWGNFLEGLAIGLFVVILQLLANFMYENLLMPLLPSHKGGVWIYSLFPLPNEEFQDKRLTVGVFEMKQTLDNIEISCGLAFMATGAQLESRGEWTSDTVSISRKRIDLIYDLSTHHSYQNEKDKEYRGHIRLNKLATAGIIGKPYSGFFNDLKDRSHIKGPIYAERVSPFRWRFEHYKKQLEARKSELLARLEAY